MNEIKQKIEENLIEVRKRKTNLKRLIKISNLFLPSIVLIIILNFFIGFARVKGDSMNNTLYEGDLVLFNRLSTTYDYDDIIVIKKVNEDKSIIKRIIGLPGDTIDIINGNVLINGIIKDEKYTKYATELQDVIFPVTLKENEYFVLGDNRINSLDSRNSETGNINKANIQGKVFFFSRLFD